MNSKQFSIVLFIGVIIGGLGLYLYKNQDASYKSSDQTLGKKLLGEFLVNDVAQVTIQHGTNEVNLVKQDDVWKVKERFNYPANFGEISEFVRKASELKVVQSVKVGASQFSRLELVKGDKGSNAPTQVEFKDKSGKAIKSMLLGKKHVKQSQQQDSSPFGGGGGDWPDGRYVLVGDGAQGVAVVSDPLSNVEPKPDQWLNKDFIKVEKIKSVAIASPVATNSWKVSRETETGDWQLADKKEGEDFDKGKVSGLNYALSSPSFNDVVAPDAKPEDLGFDQPTVATIETFDKSVYTVKVGKHGGDENYFINVAVAADIAKERTPGKEEKPEDKAKLDKEFNEKTAKQKEKFDKEKAYEKWTFQISKWTVDALLKDRKDLMAEKKAEAKPGDPAAKKDDPTADDKDEDEKK
ncbi:MAG: DUF4340 domain-containing protein [Verrucomicrobia bacterium]|nr:DUF4340 domain-containing protein [Verrucomicrobiota bacterium]